MNNFTGAASTPRHNARKAVLAVVAGVALAAGAVSGPSVAADRSPLPGSAVSIGAPRAAGPSVGSRVVRGTKSTGRYMPETYGYRLKVPTLKGVTPAVKKAFDKRIDSLVAAELAYYGQGALTQEQFTTTKTAEGGANTPMDEWKAWCRENFWDLTGQFTSSVYKDRYASVVVTFTGQNAPCIALGGLRSGYESNRSVTIDTKTGKFKSLTDFTSNTGGKVTAAVKAWYAKQSHEFLPKRPTVTKKLKVCDRPGGTYTDSPTQQECYPDASVKTGPVAWLVQDKGLRLSFPAGEGLRHATLKWSQIPERL